MHRKALITLAISTLLIVAVGLIAYGQTRTIEPTFHGKLAEVLPPAPAGWTRTEQPIADTPEMRQKVDELLSFDDGVFYIYTSGALRLSVYVAYWKPGEMSSRLVAGHTPDVCWVGNGWKCTERGEASYKLTALSSKLYPAEARTFIANGVTEYVWFWHLVDGVPQSYGTGKRPPWYAALGDIIRRGFKQRSEQFFIRLSSPQQLTDPALQPVLNAVLRSLPLLDAKMLVTKN